MNKPTQALVDALAQYAAATDFPQLSHLCAAISGGDVQLQCRLVAAIDDLAHEYQRQSGARSLVEV